MSEQFLNGTSAHNRPFQCHAQSERKEEISLDSEETSVGCRSNDDDYRNERVNAGIDPRPDLLHQSVVTVGSAAVRHVVAVQLPCTM